MPKILLVTNDFPPTLGGIQSYLRDFVSALPADQVVVFCSTQDSEAAAEYDASQSFSVIRWPHRILLPTPAVAARMHEIIVERDIDTVWFGAAAPLGLLAPRARRAGARRIVSTTHGHEVGWATIPGARQLLARIGKASDVVTYISEYTRVRIARAMGPHPEYVPLPSGVDTGFFHPIQPELRRPHQVCCVSRLVRRKGQDKLLQAWPRVREAVPDAELVIVGEGPLGRTLERLAQQTDGVRLLGRTTRDRMRDVIAQSGVFAMPARTRLGGIDVEGLGIVYLEAQACGVAVIAGDSGGAPETVTPRTAVIVDGYNLEQLTTSLIDLLKHEEAARSMGVAGRAHAEQQWSADRMAQRLRKVLQVE